MIVMRSRVSGIPRLVLMAMLGAIGCHDDKRLAQYAQQSVEQQARQNEHIARQSEAVAKQSQELAEAAHRMVEADARSRQELVQAQRELNTELQAERVNLDRRRDDLEQDRRRIAETQHRDPIVAAIIQGTAVVLACLLPLLVCAYALRQLSRNRPEDDGLSELLAQELVADEPLLLAGWREAPPAIGHQRPPEPSDQPGNALQTGDMP
jgi:hypothetical protein